MKEFTEAQRTEFANTLELVAIELQTYANHLRSNSNAEWDHSTYALEAQFAVYNLLKADKRIT